MKRRNFPEQLRLELHCDLLECLMQSGAEANSFTDTARVWWKEYPSFQLDSDPIIEAIRNF